ncbi:MAG: isoprenylcysteine carboxylmethyltransferase family protein [Pseudomonadota bacterium]|uniref:methyltransferase family protein n=1 Tax=Alcanivorax sp. TaxID=1872427 RepID=UPI0025C682AE|nr:isoprenylcysteine carboxylmethyltransferase family protein [Alcanivorax sp.]MED5239412.1 isoprenylcysteine carboxylmethyltransferase family protein [Pseudomonadota bacterium]MEE3320323.1 isoprenylcysteine carboxylmethyltransferase family protein [Pseudomonadota bacterium]
MPHEHPQVMMPPPALYLGGLLMGYGIDQATDFPALTFAGNLWLMLGLAVAGMLLVLAAVIQLRRAKTTVMPHRAARTLLTNGVFALSRNPIYLGFTCLAAAMALSQQSAGMLLMLIPVVWVIHSHVIAAEEAFHAQQFGAQWQAYCQRTRRWL